MGDKKGPDWVGVPIAFLFRSAQLGHNGRERENGNFVRVFLIIHLTMVSKQNHRPAEANSPGGLQDGQAGDRGQPRPSVNNDKKLTSCSVVKNSQM